METIGCKYLIEKKAVQKTYDRIGSLREILTNKMDCTNCKFRFVVCKREKVESLLEALIHVIACKSNEQSTIVPTIKYTKAPSTALNIAVLLVLPKICLVERRRGRADTCKAAVALLQQNLEIYFVEMRVSSPKEHTRIVCGNIAEYLPVDRLGQFLLYRPTF